MREIIIQLTDEGELIPIAELVRCKDCKHQRVDRYGHPGGIYSCDKDNKLGFDNEWCSFGERRECETEV